MWIGTPAVVCVVNNNSSQQWCVSVDYDKKLSLLNHMQQSRLELKPWLFVLRGNSSFHTCMLSITTICFLQNGICKISELSTCSLCFRRKTLILLNHLKCHQVFYWCKLVHLRGPSLCLFLHITLSSNPCSVKPVRHKQYCFTRVGLTAGHC